MATYNITSFADFQAKVASAATGDILDLGGQTFTATSQTTIAKSITVQNGKLIDAPVICLYVNSHFRLTCKFLEISGSGRQAIRSHNFGNITIEDSTFKNNSGSQGGAVLLGYGGTMTLLRSHFEGNNGAINAVSTTKGFSAGAVSGFQSNHMVVTDCTFLNNIGFNGGAIYAIFSRLQVSNCTFTTNQATGQGGGAIFVDGFTPASKNIKALHGICTILNSRFTGNTCNGQGGAIQAYGYRGDKTIIHNCIIEDNQATTFTVDGVTTSGKGGGVFLVGQNEIVDTSFIRNKSSHQGAGIGCGNAGYADMPSSLKAVNCLFYQNEVVGSSIPGGAVMTGLASMIFERCTFAENIATSQAGGAQYGSGYNIRFKSCIMANNVAPTNKNTPATGIDGGGNNFEFGGATFPFVTNRTVQDPQFGALTMVNGKYSLPTAIASGATPTATTWTTTDDTVWLQGAATADTLQGLNKPMVMMSGYGASTIIGGTGRNIVIGYAGNDKYVFPNWFEPSNSEYTANHIGDWATGEKIDISGVLNKAGHTNTNKSVYVQLTMDGTSTIISVKPNGDSDTDFKPFVRVQGKTVAMSDLIL